jgi:hypothetical protein
MTISSKGLSSAALNVIISIFMVLILIGSLIMLGFSIIIIVAAIFAIFGVQYSAILMQFYSDTLAACMELAALILLPLCGIAITIWLAMELYRYFSPIVRGLITRVMWAREQTLRDRLITRMERLLAQCDCPVEVEVREDCDD